jgi:hypothetical protein
MFSRKADGPLEVHIPRAADDHPSWVQVGVIAVIGFVVGVAWPRLAGVRLGPNAPAEAGSSVAAAAPAPSAPDRAQAPVTVASAGPAATSSSPAAAAVAAPGPSAAHVSVAHGVVFACKTRDGDSLKGGDCGTLPGFDGVVMPRLRKLADCPDAGSASGKLHLVVRPDFGRGSVGVDLGRGQGLPGADGLLACARTELAGAALTGVAHDNQRYSVAYTLTFGPAEGEAAGAAAPGSASSGAASATPAADEGTAQVVWEVAIVRDAPRSGRVVARLQRGTALQVGVSKDGWYPVKFGDDHAGAGWVYRGAIGR